MPRPGTQSESEPRDRAQSEVPSELDLDAIELPDAVREAIDQLRRERDEAIDARKRAQADFLNFQRRARENEIRAERDGYLSIVRSLLPVLDHFDLALNQDPDQLTIGQLLGGVRIVREELDRALETKGVRAIHPEPGDEFDPNQHQAVSRVSTLDFPPHTIAHLLQIGYAAGDLVLRPASVAVAVSPEDA